MAQTQTKAQNHFVPRSYLKRWSPDGHRVWTYRLLVPHDNVDEWSLLSIKTLASRLHLYTQALPEGESDDLERWLQADFEDPAKLAIDRLEAGRTLGRRDYVRLFRFCAAQDVRTEASYRRHVERVTSPEAIGMVREILESAPERYAEYLRDCAEAAEQGLPLPLPHARDAQQHPMMYGAEGRKRPPGPPTHKVTQKRIEGEGAFIGAKVNTGRSHWVNAIYRNLDVNIAALSRHRWTVMRPPEGMTWPTSDDPVIKLNFRSPTEYTFGGGWASPGTEIMLPLSPQHLLYTQIGSTHVPKEGTRFNRKWAEFIRRMIVEHSYLYVFADAHDQFLPFAKRRTVDAAAHKALHEGWKRWHAKQSEVEREFYADEDAS